MYKSIMMVNRRYIDIFIAKPFFLFAYAWSTALINFFLSFLPRQVVHTYIRFFSCKFRISFPSHLSCRMYHVVASRHTAFRHRVKNGKGKQDFWIYFLFSSCTIRVANHQKQRHFLFLSRRDETRKWRRRRESQANDSVHVLINPFQLSAFRPSDN